MKKTNLLLVMGLLTGLNFNSVKGAAAADDSGLFGDAYIVSDESSLIEELLNKTLESGPEDVNDEWEMLKATMDLKNYDNFIRSYTGKLMGHESLGSIYGGKPLLVLVLNKQTQGIMALNQKDVRAQTEILETKLRYLSNLISTNSSSSTIKQYIDESFKKILEQAQEVDKSEDNFFKRLLSQSENNPTEFISSLQSIIEKLRNFIDRSSPISFHLYKAFCSNQLKKVMENLENAAKQAGITTEIANLSFSVKQDVLRGMQSRLQPAADTSDQPSLAESLYQVLPDQASIRETTESALSRAAEALRNAYKYVTDTVEG